MTEPTRDTLREQATDAFIAQTLPGWLAGIDPARLIALRDCFERYMQTQLRVQAAFSGLTSLSTFARTSLQKKLHTSMSLTLALDQAQWREERRKLLTDVSGVKTYESYFVRVPALQKLMQNFKHDEPFFEQTALVYPSDVATGRAEQVLTTDTASVVKLCREADVGKKYQEDLDSVIDAECQKALAEDKLAQFSLAVELAALKKHLPADEVAMLRRFVDKKPLTHPHMHRVQVGALQVIGCRVEGALAFGLQQLRPSFRDPSPFVEKKVILYLPGDPKQPLRSLDSWQAASWALGALLRDPAYAEDFVQRIAISERAGFITTLRLRLRDENTDATCACEEMEESAFQTLAAQQSQRIRDNARFLAVPTEQVDKRASSARLEMLESVGMGLVGLAGLFVPVIGTLLVTQWVGETLSEVFEGVHDWKQGHQHEAIEHLLGVVETVAVSAALAAGTTLVARGFTRSTHVDQLVPVLNDAGEQRLWSGDISHYEDKSPPSDLLEQDNGLLANGDGHWWRNGGKYYQVRPAQGRSVWQLHHPERQASYGPTLEFNGERSWRLSSERPLEWEGEGLLLERLWPGAASLSTERISQILKVADVDQAHLRGLLVEGRALAVELRDTLERFAVDARVDAFFEQLNQGQDYDAQFFQWCGESLKLDAMSLEEQRLAFIDNAASLREQLFEHFSQQYLTTDPLRALLSRDFSGLPDAYALDVLKQATDTQRQWMLKQDRIPLAVAERAREHLQLAKVTRAREGFYLKGSYQPESVSLVFALLRKHASLSGAADIELREGSDTGRSLARLHPQNDPQRITTVLVKQPGGFKCYDLQGHERDVELADAVNIAEVLARYLAKRDLARLTWDGAQASEQIAYTLRAWLPAGREAVAELMGLREIKPPRSPLRRLPDGRFGYLLNGREEQQHPSRRLLLEAVSALYPAHPSQLLDEYVSILLQSPRTAYAILIGQYRQYLALDRSMDNWVRAAPAGNMRGARRFVAEEFRRSWRLDGPSSAPSNDYHSTTRLTLVGLDVRSLPTLPADTDFKHITDLILAGLHLETVPQGFLRCFPRLRWLNLSDNALVDLPVEVGELSQLRTLRVARNRIRMTEEAVQSISRLAQLEILDLSANRLGPVSLRLEDLPRLRDLNLSRANLQSIPAGLERCAQLRVADLRYNQIAQLPNGLLQASLQVRRAVRLDNNALPVAERERLHAANPLTGQATAADQAFGRARADWLEQAQAPAREGHGRRWDALLVAPDNAEFFRLLVELTRTSDFQRVPKDLSRRVWAVIEAASENDTLRGELFQLAASRGCVDLVISCFSTLEVRVLLAQAMSGAGNEDEEGTLLELARGLFRLDRVEAIAREDVERRVLFEQDRLRSHGYSDEEAHVRALERIDAVEVSLAYRVGLAGKLKLPGQPRTMQFEHLAGVKPMQLSNAAASVRWAAGTDALPIYVSQRDFWIAYLERHHGTEFQQVKQPFWDQLEEQGTDDLARVAQIQEAFDTAVRELAVRLTRKALDRHPPAE